MQRRRFSPPHPRAKTPRLTTQERFTALANSETSRPASLKAVAAWKRPRRLRLIRLTFPRATLTPRDVAARILSRNSPTTPAHEDSGLVLTVLSLRSPLPRRLHAPKSQCRRCSEAATAVADCPRTLNEASNSWAKRLAEASSIRKKPPPARHQPHRMTLRDPPRRFNVARPSAGKTVAARRPISRANPRQAHHIHA